jgi:hypothetical protein
MMGTGGAAVPLTRALRRGSKCSPTKGPLEVADGDRRFLVVDPFYKIREKKRRATDETGAHRRDRAVPFGRSGERLGLVGLGPLGVCEPIGEERMKPISEGGRTNVRTPPLDN